MTEYSLQTYYLAIEEEIPFIDKKPFSHNLISLYLRMINEKFGEQAVVNYIADSDLKDLGWGYILEETKCDY
tara:strand:- start:151 stop:366 length:216 start_codon:yes stop_codon:yes gene_type:complete